MDDFKFIHLLYVPTLACNMACKYCYLEDNTQELKTDKKYAETLKYAIKKFNDSKVYPFNISLHGGEVTCLSHEDFESIIKIISDYYKKNSTLITSHGFKIGSPHIKTNLYAIDKHIDTIQKYNVSMSGSLDLPLSLHDEYRVTKGNKKTLDKIINNIKLFNGLSNKRKVSATIFKEHYEKIDEIINDIKWLNENTTLDMNDFNFMIGFDYNSNGILHHLTEKEQVDFFKRMHKEFDNTELDAGVNGAWFNEFGPDYCTNCTNCGDKFFLLEKNGDIYSCVRGQKNKDFFYGNIYDNTVEEILAKAQEQIFKAHNRVGFNSACAKCPYLYICKTGCPFVKNVYKSNKSYTCKLQQELYKSRNYEKDANPEESAYYYLLDMHPELASKYVPKQELDIPSLEEIIKEDNKLEYIYSDKVFILNVDGYEYNLSSQVLKSIRDIVYISKDSSIKLYIKNDAFEKECDYPQNNSLYMMLLSGDLIKYGDEGRTKQRHVMTHQIYEGVIKKNKSDKKGYYVVDISDVLKLYLYDLDKNNPNNLFFTTSALRDYHYTKQKNNAYYHIQAINLPFQNIEFYILEEE
ncbi:MAG: radical SAM protein [Bacilli bacterium]|nr:radical SAM protein [Bacilli bacterium]